MDKYYIAVDIGATKTLLGIFDENSTLKYKVKFPTCKDNFNDNLFKMKEKTLDYVKDHLEERILGIGIGIPAVYDEKNNLSKWENVRIKEVLNSEIDTEVCVHTDVYAALIGEKMFGIAKNASNFVNISVGTGIGMGIYTNDCLYTGANNFAGGIGHTIYKVGGDLCVCGKQGCVENYVCGKAMERLFKQRITNEEYKSSILYKQFKEGDRVTSFDIINAAFSDRLCKNIINEIGFNLGIVISNVIMLFDPEVVILNGGVITNSPEYLVEKINKTISENLFSKIYLRTRIERSVLGEEANLYGNYWLIKNYERVKNSAL